MPPYCEHHGMHHYEPLECIVMRAAERDEAEREKRHERARAIARRILGDDYDGSDMAESILDMLTEAALAGMSEGADA